MHSFHVNNEKSRKLSFTGKLLIGVTGGVAVTLTVICTPFVSPALRKICLPFVPATNKQIENVLAALKGRSGKVLDLGSGDGRIVLEAAGKGFISHGVELNLWLVLYSYLNSFRKGYGSRTKFYRRDLWKFNLSPYENLVIFGVEQMMVDLEKKFLSECKPNCHIVACRFPLPNLTPTHVIGQVCYLSLNGFAQARVPLLFHVAVLPKSIVSYFVPLLCRNKTWKSCSACRGNTCVCESVGVVKVNEF